MEKRNRIAYALALIAALAFTFVYGGRLPYTLLFFTLLLPIMSLIYLIYVHQRFKYSKTRQNKEVTKGEVAKFGVSISNEDLILYPYMSLTLTYSDAISPHFSKTKYFSLMPNTQKTFNYQVHCKYRGIYKVGVDDVCMWDLLCLFKLRYNAEKEKSIIIVYPRIIPLENFPIYSIASEDDRADVFLHQAIENIVISDIRKYQYGDPMNKIHWKLSAKSNELQVKNYSNSAEVSTIIIIDLHKQCLSPDIDIEREDSLIETATSIIHYCLTKLFPISVLYFDAAHRTLKGKSPDDFKPIHKELALMQFSPEPSLDEIFKHGMDADGERTNIILISLHLDASVCDNLISSAQRGYNVIFITIRTEGEAFDEMLTVLRENNILVFIIHESL